MAEKMNQQEYPLAPATRQSRSDEESSTLRSEELKRKKRIKLAIYIAAFAVFQTIVILVFALTVMRVKTPKVRLGTDVTFQNFKTGTQASPTFDLSFTTQVGVKNTNFGPYKFDSTIATFMYQGVTVGQVTIPKGKAGLRSTKKVGVIVNVDSNALSSTAGLGSELGAGVLTLNSQAKLSGKVELMFVMKKKKSAEMNCTMTIEVSTKAIQTMSCE
ncbi:late embryogenesis abundant protein At1g64065-like [Quercus robur]|uniref:late embryogenesis abundant protein At1g64065-like n=1 Tax=Quercus robur TaxID=38942 RepID=UPI002161A9BA|nr:late embryogenesis abundant protein At1g64065-like [Quercus robur]